MSTPITTRVERVDGEVTLWVGEENGIEIGIPQSSPMWGEIGADRFLEQAPQRGEKGPSDYEQDQTARINRIAALTQFYNQDGGPPEEGYTSVGQLTPQPGAIVILGGVKHVAGDDLGSDVPLFRAVNTLAARVIAGGRKLSHAPLEGGMDG
jgi:hypothetical protein